MLIANRLLVCYLETSGCFAILISNQLLLEIFDEAEKCMLYVAVALFSIPSR
jgi:hypothetical protein